MIVLVVAVAGFIATYAWDRLRSRDRPDGGAAGPFA